MPKTGFLIAFALLISACGSAAPTAAATEVTPPEAEIRALIETFGAKLQMVSLLAPDAADQIQAQYADYVAPDLLQAWMADPSTAPGRLTSSPWPDRIEIASIEQSYAGYQVSGMVIEITSVEVGTDNAAAQYPVDITVTQIDGKWLISGWAAAYE